MTIGTIDLETLYRETGNPLFVFAAIADVKLCPDGAPWPNWVTEYLRYAGETLEDLAKDEQPGG
jgi:hypothetical protein